MPSPSKGLNESYIPAVFDRNVTRPLHLRFAEPDYFVVHEANEDDLEYCALDKVFEDGKLFVDPKFSEIRDRARAGI